ncbi:hypothetical protein HMPREF9238_00444 [Gleimia europaea ACS-120-V-Col10b]|uniref:Uncharacterized protein n=1 Tax=Gleimia europaea ACS-120-V-Col10b TaxID=883069 RepID=A0A9W5VW99_9ACTO|nr:hypothetical protein HMPREF9238_00444 [Gleimia europaea ACS-120-V-Col10b]
MGEVTAVVGIGGMGTTVLEVFTQKFAKEAAATGISMRTVAVNRPQDSLDQAQAQKKDCVNQPRYRRSLRGRRRSVARSP